MCRDTVQATSSHISRCINFLPSLDNFKVLEVAQGRRWMCRHAAKSSGKSGELYHKATGFAVPPCLVKALLMPQAE